MCLRMLPACAVALTLFATWSDARVANGSETEYQFDVDAGNAYAELRQGEPADGTLIFWFSAPIHGLDRVVIFFNKSCSQPSASEQSDLKRLVVNRPLSDFATFGTFQNQPPGVSVYGSWTNIDGAIDVTKFVLQAYRGSKASRLPLQDPKGRSHAERAAPGDLGAKKTK